MQPTPRGQRGSSPARGRRGSFGTPGTPGTGRTSAFSNSGSGRGGNRGGPGTRRASPLTPKRPTGIRVSRLAKDDSNDALRHLVEPVIPLSPVATAAAATTGYEYDEEDPEEEEGEGEEPTTGGTETNETPQIANANTGISSFMRAENNTGRADRFTNDLMQTYNALKAKREKLRVEYIRQGKIAHPNAKQQLEDAVDLVGECEEMCPEFERVDREMSGTVDPLEKDEFGKTSADRAVKRFKRSSAGDGQPLPCDVRPPPVLLMTLDYLVRNIVGKHPLVTCHRFVGDRLRAIANDFIVQNYRGAAAIRCTEVISRYYIFALHDLGDLTEVQGVSQKQDLKMLMDNLKTLTEMYQDFHALEPDEMLENEAEFMAYYLLVHPTTLSDIPFLERTLSHDVMMSPQVQFAISLRELLQRNPRNMRGFKSEGGHRSMATFFRILRDDPRASPLVTMVAELQFGNVRCDGLQSMDRAYNPNYPFPAEELAEWMGLDAWDQAIAWAEQCGLQVGSLQDASGESTPAVHFNRKGPSGRTLFAMPDEAAIQRLSRRSKTLIADKLAKTTVVDMLMGGLPTQGDMFVRRVRLPAPVTPSARQPARPAAGVLSTRLPSFTSAPGTSPTIPQVSKGPFSVAPSPAAAPTVPSFGSKSAVAEKPGSTEAPKAPVFNFGKAAAAQMTPQIVPPKAPAVPEKMLPETGKIPLEPLPKTMETAVPPPPKFSMPVPNTQERPPLAISPLQPSSQAKETSVTKPGAPATQVSLPIAGTRASKEVPAVSLPTSGKSKLISEVAANVLAETIVEETIRIATRTVSESSLIRTRVTQLSMAAVVYGKVMSLIAEEIAEKVLRSSRRARRLQRWVVRRWRRYCKEKTMKRGWVAERNATLARDQQSYMETIRNLTLSMEQPIVPLAAQPMLDHMEEVIGSPERAMELDESVHIFLESLVRGTYRVLNHEARRPSTDFFRKIVISAPSILRPQSSVEWNTVRWLRELFGLVEDGNEDEFEPVGDSDQIFTETLLRAAFRPTASSALLHLLIQRVDISTPGRDADIVRREEGHITGPSAALFLLSPYDGSRPIDTYWELEQDRLDTFMSLLPLEGAIPMLFVTNSSLPDRRMWDSSLRTRVELIARQYSPTIGAVEFSSLSESTFRADDSFSGLSTTLTELSRVGVPTPRLTSSSFLELWDEYFRTTFDEVVRRLDTNLSDPALDVGVSSARTALNVAVELLNVFIQISGSLISSDRLHAVPFPAAEFIDEVQPGMLPPVGWNGRLALALKREQINSLRVPPTTDKEDYVGDDLADVIGRYAQDLVTAIVEPQLGEDVCGLVLGEVSGTLRGSDRSFERALSTLARFVCLAIDSALREVTQDSGATCIFLVAEAEATANQYRNTAIERLAKWEADFIASSSGRKAAQTPLSQGYRSSRKRNSDYGDQAFSPKRVRVTLASSNADSSLGELLARLARASSTVEGSVASVERELGHHAM